MTGALSARPRSVRLTVAGAAAGACAVLASVAAAAQPAQGTAAQPAQGTAAQPAQGTAELIARSSPGVPAVRAHQAGSRSLRTLFATVRVFRSAARGGVSGKLIRQGTAVSITCWTTGSYYHGVPIWYAISAPVAGYVSAFNLAAHFSPAIGIPHCLAPPFSEVFNGLEAHLRIRTGPSVAAKVSGHLGAVGSKVTIDCYEAGTPIFKDPVWYHATSPAKGFVSGRMLNTGGDPAPGVPHC